MDLKERKCKPDNIQNSQQMTPSTKFNFKFATLPIFSSKKITNNIAFIQQDQRRKKIYRNEGFYNLTSNNIS